MWAAQYQSYLHSWAMSDKSVTSGTGLCRNADAGLRQFTSGRNAEAGLTFARHSGIPAFTYDSKILQHHIGMPMRYAYLLKEKDFFYFISDKHKTPLYTNQTRPCQSRHDQKKN